MKKNVIKNIIQLYGLNIAKMVFPLITLPYLTRVLSVDAYGIVAYVKSVMSYMQLIVDFGFMLSGTKAILEHRHDKEEIGKVASDVLLARVLLAIISFLALIVLCFVLPILEKNRAFTLFSFVPVFLSVFLFDYIFRGLEKMQIITNRFVVMKGIATVLTILLIKNDSDILLIPLLDSIGSVLAVSLVVFELKKERIRIGIGRISDAINALKESAVYFLSEMSSTIFGALNTVLIGAFLSEGDVAFWSVCMQLITAVQAMYTPITSGVYPEMVKSKEIRNITKLLKLFMPIICIGCVFTFLVSGIVLRIVGGPQYEDAAYLLRLLTPLLFFSFPAVILGWPTLGAIGMVKEVTSTTIISAVIQLAGLVLLYYAGWFNLVSLAVLRCVTELVLLATRFVLCVRNKNRFIYVR